MEYPWKRLDYSLVDYSDGIVVLSGGGIHLPPVNNKIIEWNNEVNETKKSFDICSKQIEEYLKD